MKIASRVRPLCAGLAAALLSVTAITSAHAADGCKFLLCIAGPWSSISECIPTVHEVLYDIARGRPVPSCDMSGADNSAMANMNEEASCPSMYQMLDGETGRFVGCTYPERIDVYVRGQLWSEVYFDYGGNTSTLWSDTARLNLGSVLLDDKFRADLIGWNDARTGECSSSYGSPVFDSFGAFQRCDYPYSAGG